MLRTESIAVNRIYQTIKSACGSRARLTTCLMVFIIGLLCTTSSVNAQGRDEVIFFFNDALGSAVAAVSEQGELCWSEDYTPYGDKTINDDVFSTRGCGVVGEERGFTGHTEDVNSDLVYMQQRYYDPSIGRFLSIDPLDAAPGKPQTLNRYAYANNNPYSYRDPDGQLPIAIVGIFAVGAVISAYDSYQAYKEGGLKALGETLAVEAAMAATGGGKLMMKAGKALKSVADSAEIVPNSGNKPLLGNNAKVKKDRTNTDLDPFHDRSTAKSIFRNQTNGQEIEQFENKNGDIIRRADDGTQIRMNRDGSTRVDLPDRGNQPNGETIHFNP